MNYSWSTPLRRNGQTDLPLIPNEIYLHIFECIAPIDRPLSQYFDQDIKIFSALALVCRFFRFVALPRIFEGVTFSAKKHRDSTLASRKSEWATQILANDEPAMSLALYVRECTFDTLALHEEEKWPFENLYCQAMARMSNIRKVVFSCLFVKIDHWEALAGLKQLDSLHLDSCSFIDDPPDKELTVRFVWLSYPSTTFTLRPVATTSLRSLKANDVEVVLKIVAFRQLAIESLFLDQQLSDIEPLLQVFQHLPSLLGVRFQIEGQALASSYSKLSLKKLFTRLLSFTIYVIDVGVTHYYTDDTKMLVSSLCGGSGTLPSLKALNIYLDSHDHLTVKTLSMNIIYNCINEIIVPAFPNVRCIQTNTGYMCLEEGNWKVHYFYKS